MPWASVSLPLFSAFFLGPGPFLPSPPSPQPALNPPGTLDPFAPFRRRLLLDDLGWVPVVPVDQRLDLGGLGRSGVGGGRRRAAARRQQQPRPQTGRGSRPAQSTADPHARSSQLSVGRRGYVISPRPRACCPPPSPPRDQAPCSFEREREKGVPLPLLPARWRLVRLRGEPVMGGGGLRGSRGDFQPAEVDLLTRRV